MWDWFIDFLFNCVQAIQSVVLDWGLAIIIFTVIIRLFLLPLTFKQQKSMAEMQTVTPLLQEIQTKYADDPQRMNEEMTKFYAEHKFNPLAGCLPMLIQMPIFMAFFTVLREKTPDTAAFYNILPHLNINAGDVLSQYGIVAAIPYVIFVILFGVLTFLPMYLTQNQNSMTKNMGIMMTIMMLFVGWTSPAGLVLYWVVSSAWAVVQQQLIFNKKKAEVKLEQEAAKATKPVEVDVVRKTQKKRPHKKR